MGPDGTGLAKIDITSPDGSPARHAFDVSFSPDGRRIVFSIGGAEPGIYLANSDGSNGQRLTTSPPKITTRTGVPGPGPRTRPVSQWQM